MAVPVQRERIGMSLDDFLATGKKIEIINGRMIEQMPNLYGHVETVYRLFLALYQYILADGAALEVRSEATFVLPETNKRKWVSGARIPDVMVLDKIALDIWKSEYPDYRSMPLSLVPLLAIEVVSETDRLSEVDEKVDVYLEDGVKLVWIVDPQRRKVTVHAPDFENPVVLKGADTLDGGDILPGFKIALPDLFA